MLFHYLIVYLLDDSNNIIKWFNDFIKRKLTGSFLMTDMRFLVFIFPSARVASISWKMITIVQHTLTVSLTGCLKEATLMMSYSLTRWEIPYTSQRINVSFL
ncbi:hypothetical protein BSCG_05775 [Bacteroides sp. 2_2_4]|nr:hypothetical protein BSCG_05775 [Bacteroides sp. 2_2_4]